MKMIFKKEFYNKEIKPELDGKKVGIGGWIHNIRELGGLLFVQLRDSTGIVQLVVPKKKVGKEIFDKFSNLSKESVVGVKGVVKKNKQAPNNVEVLPEELIVFHKAKTPLPLPIDEKSNIDLGTIFKKRHISLRRKKYVHVFRIRAEIGRAVREFLNSQGFSEIWTPLTVATATEGGAEVFPVVYFDKEVFLAQSSQFYKQCAISCLEKVYGILPCFRAELSRTRHHLCELWQIDIEMAFKDLDDLMDLQENLIKHVVKRVKENCKESLKYLGRELPEMNKSFPRYTWEEAKKKIKELGVKEDPNDDLSTEGEIRLSEEHDTPFFIYDWPEKIRGIYYGDNPEKEGFTNSVDMIPPEGFKELSTGGERVDDPEILTKRIKSKGYDPAGFKWYIEMFESGMPPHSGCGIGMERLTMWITGVNNIREVVMFPRTPDTLKP